MVGMVGIRAILTIVGLVGIALFLGGGLGTGPLASVTGPPPCTTCVPHIFVAPPGVSSTGLNATILVFGSVSPPRFIALQSEVLTIQGSNTPISLLNQTSSPTTGAFILPPFSYKASAGGSYTVLSTITGLVSGSRVQVTATSPAVTFTVHPATTGNSSTQCGTGGCPTVTPSFTAAGFGLRVIANDTSKVTNATSSTSTFVWGDGVGPVSGAVGQSASHAYATTGVYTITDTVSATSASGVTATGSITVTVSVAPGTVHNVTTNLNNTGTTITPTGFNSLTDSGLGAFIGVTVMGVTGRFKEGLLLTLGLAAGGYFLGPLL